MPIPPNIEHFFSAIGPEETEHFDWPYLTLVCPICDFDYNHIGSPRIVSGEDDYQAWYGRGDLVVIPFEGECGSQWEYCFGFHKGHSAGFIRVRKSCSEKSYLYFIEAEGTGFIKIGRSVNPEKRLANLATGSPNNLSLIGTISGGHELEKILHGEFAHLRERGEWFRADARLRQFIKHAIG